MPRFIKNFAPSWPSIVMGTGVIPLALTFSEGILPGAATLALAFSVLSAFLFLLVLILSLARLVFCWKDFAADMANPVSVNFVPTLPIAAMILSLDIALVGPRFMGESAALWTAFWLFAAGTAGIYALGWAAVAIMFAKREVKLAQATFGWFIPPVSQLIVPVVGLDLAARFIGTDLALPLFMLSLFSLGIGSVLFLFVGANVYHRYLYHELPGPRMAPTVMIGLAPTAILVIILVKLSALSGLPGSPWPLPAFKQAALVLAPLGWGFSAWWFVLAVIVLLEHLKSAVMDFALSWWSLSFPVGALAVSTGAMNKLYRLEALAWTGTSLTILLLGIWTFVLVMTIKLILSGKAFEKHE